MTPERWRRLEALYHAAQARPAAERTAFLVEACGDDAALREEVATLLAQPGFDLMTSPFTSAGATSGTPSLAGRRLGI
jgi:hypothetical protein